MTSKAIWTILSYVLLLPAIDLEAGEPPTPDLPMRLTLREGSVILGRLKVSGPGILVNEAGREEPVHWPQVRRLSLASRLPPELELQIDRTLTALGSDQYEVRQQALNALRSLGAIAVSRIAAAGRSGDVEVAARARELLAEMGSPETSRSQDEITTADGTLLRGRLKDAAFEVLTRFGRVRVPSDLIDQLETGVDIPTLPAVAPGDPLPAALPQAGKALQAERVDPQAGDGFSQGQAEGVFRAGFDFAADGKTALKAGDRLETAYAAWGLLLHGAGATPVMAQAGGATIQASAGGGDLECTFVRPGTYQAETASGRPGGVHRIGCWLSPAPPGRIGMEAFDFLGRRIQSILIEEEQLMGQRGPTGGPFLGLRSETPMARVRIFRVADDPPVEVRIDDLVFDRVAPADRDQTLGLVELLDGERLVGVLDLASATEAGLALRPSFLPASSAPTSIPWSEVRRLEPPRPPYLLDDETPLDHAGLPSRSHQLLLQNGACLRAGLLRLDATTAVLRLPGGVQLTLPRAALRKVDLWPDSGKEATLKIAEGEKPGIDLRQKERPAGEEAKAKGPAEGIPRMEGAEVLSIDFESGEMVVDPKDGAGAWSIDLKSARYLVFPALGAPAAPVKKPEWMLTLREGSRFPVSIQSIGPHALRLEIVGAPAEIPFEAMEAVERGE